MLDDLIAVLRALKQCMKTHEASLKAHETATRMALIDPLLRALGWDTANPSLVRPEYPIDNGWSDYALMGQGSQNPVAVIEAKKLGSSLTTREIRQVMAYAIEPGIPYAGLTNGDHWQLYDIFKRAPLQDCCILDISIREDPIHQCALALLSLWQLNLASSKPVGPLKPFPYPEPDIPTPSDTTWCPLPEWETRHGPKPPRPTTIRFRDGEEQAINSWHEILVQTADWLMQRGKLTLSDVPVSSGRNRYIVHSERVHSDGKEFIRAKAIDRNGMRLFIQINLSALQARRHTERLLRHCNEQPTDVQLKC